MKTSLLVSPCRTLVSTLISILVLSSVPAYSDTREVIQLIDLSIERQLEIEKENPDAVATFLPQVGDKTRYLKAYQTLLPELKQLGDTNAHFEFFAEYASRLLKAVELFSTDKKWWKKFNHAPGTHAMGFPCDPWASDHPRTKALLDSSTRGNETEYNSLKYNYSMIDQLKKELGEVKRSRTATYQWFILFSIRLSILATRNTQYNSYFNSSNTGYLQLGRFIESYDLWKSSAVLENLLNRGTDFFTAKMSTPLALTRLFPSIAMVPYPYELSTDDLIQTNPFQKETIFPVGFSFLQMDGVDGGSHSPSAFFWHDLQHLAILSSSHSIMGSHHRLNSAELDLLQKWLTQGRRLLSKTIKDLHEKISEIEDPTRRTILSYFLFLVAHEDITSIYTRFSRLIDQIKWQPAPYHVEELVLLMGPDRNHSESGEQKFEDQVKLFREYVLTSLDSELLQKLKQWHSHPILKTHNFHITGFLPITLMNETNPSVSNPIDGVIEIKNDYIYAYLNQPIWEKIYLHIFPWIHSELEEIKNTSYSLELVNPFYESTPPREKDFLFNTLKNYGFDPSVGKKAH